ncbi:MAG: DUF4149 domain-containing protein [Ferrovibrio sp.]|uniref:DUF4149 domain-containing protein n=1 Tax=Ferrovibrio sp. TaxID=1917215 RepID=UPI00263540B5|nr:DUF4149 domain-containing protein [Ferrovibrio sp.]MCW0233124.1 DUF4149 domain-containing protein [Ferrovibrio sp.]
MLLHAVALYATAILLGAMLFFSFIVTPVVFRALDGEHASRFLRALFPLYYLVIILLGAIAALMLALVEYPLPAAALGVTAALAVLTRQVLIPQLDALRPGRAAGEAAATRAFRRLHGLSMLLNLAQMVAVAGALSVFVL